MPRSVDDYLAALPLEVRVTLKRLRETIKAAAPEASEGISYRIPVFKFLGSLVGFAAFPNHCAFYPMSTTVLARFKVELKGHKVVGTTIHFQPGKPLPAALVRRIVKARIAENETRRQR